MTVNSAVTDTKAHPRTGGENLFTASARDDPWGSSPHGRGKPIRAMRSAASAGLIPARAGKTPRVATRQVNYPAHPRTGGEN